MTARDQLLREIEAFLARHHIPAATFGAQSMNDRAFLYRLRDGAQPRLDTAEKLRAYMDRIDRKSQKKTG